MPYSSLQADTLVSSQGVLAQQIEQKHGSVLVKGVNTLEGVTVYHWAELPHNNCHYLVEGLQVSGAQS